MAQGISIHIGLNNIDVDHYGPGNELYGCINDARDMQALAVAQGFQTWLMTDEGATSEAVIRAISGAAHSLRAGDILLITYSGHGSQVPDTNGDEPDGQDETWCLYDRMLLDDELYSLWAQFEAGVRIFVLSDSCHSGTVARMVQTRELMRSKSFEGQFRGLPRAVGGASPATIRFRFLPAEATAHAYAKSKSLYDSLQRVVGRSVRETVKASVILISGCQDDQLSADGSDNGLFTEKLKDAWHNGGFNGDHPTFHKAIAAQMPVSQTPNYVKVGDDSVFEKQRPFTVTTNASNEPVASSLWVTGPVALSRSDPAPSFRVNPGTNSYWVFEITSDPTLFDTGNARDRRTSQNFYGSWQDSSHFTGIEYTLPDEKWQLLRWADALYYRMGSTSMSQGWADYMISTPDQQHANAPSIKISGAAAAPGGPSIRGPVSIASTDPPPSFTIDTVGAPYFIVEVATEARLLDGNVPESERTADKFYATWQDGGLLTGSSYALPDAAWRRLQPETALYYRVGTTTSETGWENYALSTEDHDVASAPYVQIAGY
ncbi:caspase family protein [Paraliomyxa miuraensis]|uniref:caspase family protein n=1 Tax=Paraliomyxa miuraensis TaxID=376150 RepID=UPI002254356A|nr:caspase family protein [Paraliomyxa miuraensis]MCX4243082.1 caspase family protein [Paraliomyxa miuraensis]